MTRINVVPVEELSDQWLLAEYHELPRCIKQKTNTYDAPKNYCLGKGHMKWGKHHTRYLLLRYKTIVQELLYRGFNLSFTYENLKRYVVYNTNFCDNNFYIPSNEDVCLNRHRLIERYFSKKDFYKWTKREKPDWLKA